MIRAIALAAMLGALVASVAAYTIRPLGWWNGNTPLFAAFDRGAKTATKPEDWPICTTMALVASDAEWAQLDNPARIQALAQRHLTLKPIDPTQIEQLDSGGHRPRHLAEVLAAGLDKEAA